MLPAIIDTEFSAAYTVLRDIYTTNEGLTPALVVDHASDSESPLHRYFDWDDASAAAAFRLEQARHLIRRVKVNVITSGSEDPVRVRAFPSLPEPTEEAPQARTYTPFDVAASDEFKRAQVLGQIQAELSALRSKYAAWSDLFQEAVTAEAKTRRRGRSAA